MLTQFTECFEGRSFNAIAQCGFRSMNVSFGNRSNQVLPKSLQKARPSKDGVYSSIREEDLCHVRIKSLDLLMAQRLQLSDLMSIPILTILKKASGLKNPAYWSRISNLKLPKITLQLRFTMPFMVRAHMKGQDD